MLKKLVEILKEFAWPFGFFGGIYAFATRFVPAEWQVSIWVTGAVVAVLLSVIVSLLWHLSRRDARPFIVVDVDKILKSGSEFLSAPSAHLGYDMGARAYYRDGKHELPIGTCLVKNVQADSRALLQVKYDPGIDGDLVLKFTQNDDDARRKIRLRPGVMLDKGAFDVS